MANVKEKIIDYILQSKVKPVMRRLNTAVNFPIQADSVKKVLVILPPKAELLHHAHQFIYALRKRYPAWRVEMFDVSKLSGDDLNRMRLPRDEILHKLKAAGYHFVIDLDESSDHLSAFITVMTEAPYRLSLTSKSATYYNLTFQPHKDGSNLYYKSLLEYLGKLFVHN